MFSKLRQTEIIRIQVKTLLLTLSSNIQITGDFVKIKKIKDNKF